MFCVLCVCMFTCVFVRSYMCMCIPIHSCRYMHIRVRIYVGMYMCRHAFRYVCMYIYIQIGMIRNKQRLNYEAVQMKSFFIFFHCIYTCIQCDIVNVTCTKEQSQQMALQTADHVNSVNTVASYMYVAVYKSSEVSMGIL